MMLTSMGFGDKEATRALRKCEGNLERAAEFVMTHMGEPDTEDEPAGAMEVDQTNEEEVKNVFLQDDSEKSHGVFKMQSFITHLGASLHAGHYVAHARQ